MTQTQFARSSSTNIAANVALVKRPRSPAIRPLPAPPEPIRLKNQRLPICALHNEVAATSDLMQKMQQSRAAYECIN